MKKCFGKLLAGVMIAVMTVGSLPSIAYAGELLISEDAYCFETEEGMDDTELIEEESAPDVELSEETLDEVILSDETIEESFDGEAEYELSSEEPIFWITDKKNPAEKEYTLRKYTIKNGDALTLSVEPKWENIGETNPTTIPVTYTWSITDYYTGEKQKVEGNNTDSYTVPTDLANNNEYHIDCEAIAEYNSKTYDFEFSFWVYKHDEGITPWVNQILSLKHGTPRDLAAYNMSWDEENNILTLSGAYIKLQNYMLLPANSTIVVEKGTTNYIYGRVTFNGEGTITGEGTLNIINENSEGDCIIAGTKSNGYPITINNTKLTLNKKIKDNNVGIRAGSLTVTGDADVSINGETTYDYGALVYLQNEYLQDIGTNVEITGSDLSLFAHKKVEINGSFFAKASSAAFAVLGDKDIILGQGAKIITPTEYSIGRIFYGGSSWKGVRDASGDSAKIVKIQGLKPFSLAGDIAGEPKFGETLTVSDTMPAGATVEYQWMVSDSNTGEFVEIPGANKNIFEINNSSYIGKNIKCVVSGTGEYGSIVDTNVVGPISGPVIFDKMYIDGKALEWTTEEILSRSKSVIVAPDTEKAEIVVVGKSENDKISINDTVCNEKKVNLDRGDNNIVVSVENSEGTADYTLIVHRSNSEETVKVSFEMDSSIDSRTIRFLKSDGEFLFALGNSTFSKEMELPFGTVVTVRPPSSQKNDVTGTVFSSITQNGKRIYSEDWTSEEVIFTVGDTVVGEEASETIRIDSDSFFYAPVRPKIKWVRNDNVVNSLEFDFSSSGLLNDSSYICIPKNEFVKADVSDRFKIKIYDADNPDGEPVYSTEMAINNNNRIEFTNSSTDSFYQKTSTMLVYTGSNFRGLDSSKDYLFEFDWCEHENEELYNEIFGDCRVRLNAYEEETFRLKGESEGKTRYYIANTPGADKAYRTVKAYFSIPQWITAEDMKTYENYFACDNSALFESIKLGYEHSSITGIAGTGYIEIIAKGDTTNPVTGSANIIIYDTLKREAIKLKVDVSDTKGELAIHPETTSFSYNIYQNTGYDITASISGEYASEIKEFALVDKDKAAVSEYFSISEVDYRTLRIKPSKNYYKNSDDANQLVKKKSVVYYLRADLKDGSYVYSDKPITIKLSKTAPSVSAKAVSFNSFYSDNAQNIAFTSKQGAVNKAVLNETKMTALPLWLTLSKDGMKLSCKENGYKGSTKLYLNAYVEGYDAPASVTVSVSAASKAPNVKLRNTTIKVSANKNTYLACPAYIDSKDKKVSFNSLNITGVRVATQYDLARLSSKDAKKYAASGSYGAETKEDFAEGCFYISHKDTKNNPVSGTILLIFTVDNNVKQEFSLPLTVKALTLDSKNKWKTDTTSVTLFTATANFSNYKYVNVIYPVDCCKHDLECNLLSPDGKYYNGTDVRVDVDAHDTTNIYLRCSSTTPATSFNKPYTLVITDNENPELPPLKVKVFISQNLPTISFAKNSATFVQGERYIYSSFSTSVKTSDKDFRFNSDYVELTEANSKLEVRKRFENWKLYKKGTDPELHPDDYLYAVSLNYSNNLFTVSQNTNPRLFDNTKDEKYTLVLKYKDSDKCKASFKVTSLSPTGAKGLTLMADKKSVKLNLNAGFSHGESCDKVKVKITLSSGSRDMFYRNIDTTKDIKIYTSSKYKDDAHRAPADAIKVKLTDTDYNHGFYELTIAAGENCEAGKTYYLDCVSEFGPNESYGLETKPVTIAVNIMKDSIKPEVSLKASGYLDLNNIGSTVKITPVVKNVNSDVAMSAFQAHIIKYNGAKDKVGEEYHGLIGYINGKLTINKDSDEFKNGKIVPSGKNAIYKIYYTGYFGGTDPGDKKWEIQTKPIVINVKAGTAKITQSTKSVTLYKNDRFDSAYVTLSLNDSNRYTDYEYVYGYREITSVVLDNSMYDVTLVNADISNGKYTYAIGFKNNDLTVAQNAKAQTLKLKVYLKGINESGTPSATVSVSVKAK